MILIQYIIIFLFLSVLPFFISELMLYTFEPGRIFGFYGKMIGRIKNKFWYNSLGGCAVCFTQRISEITYYLFYKLFTSAYGGWITCRLRRLETPRQFGLHQLCRNETALCTLQRNRDRSEHTFQ